MLDAPYPMPKFSAAVLIVALCFVPTGRRDACRRAGIVGQAEVGLCRYARDTRRQPTAGTHDSAPRRRVQLRLPLDSRHVPEVEAVERARCCAVATGFATRAAVPAATPLRKLRRSTGN